MYKWYTNVYYAMLYRTCARTILVYGCYYICIYYFYSLLMMCVCIFTVYSANLFSAPRNLTPPLNSGVSSSALHLARLKRNSTTFASQPGPTIPLSAVACTYSLYLVTLSRLICYAQSHLIEFKTASRPTVQQLMEEYGYPGGLDDLESVTQQSEKSFDIGRLDIKSIEFALERRDSLIHNDLSHTSISHIPKTPVHFPLSDASVIGEEDEEEEEGGGEGEGEDKYYSVLARMRCDSNSSAYNGDKSSAVLGELKDSSDDVDSKVQHIALTSSRDSHASAVYKRPSTPTQELALHSSAPLNSSRNNSISGSAIPTGRTLNRSSSKHMGGPLMMARWRSESTTLVQDRDIEESSKLALRVAIESLNCLSKMDEVADDAIYRSLAEACGACGFAQE